MITTRNYLIMVNELIITLLLLIYPIKQTVTMRKTSYVIKYFCRINFLQKKYYVNLLIINNLIYYYK